VLRTDSTKTICIPLEGGRGWVEIVLYVSAFTNFHVQITIQNISNNKNCRDSTNVSMMGTGLQKHNNLIIFLEKNP
jgi:hypothetical protein